LKNVHISFKDDDFRPAMVFDDIKSLKLNNEDISIAVEMPVIVLRNVKKPLMEELKLPVENKKRIRILNK